MMASEYIQVLIKYDGLWDEIGTYKNYKATGMLLPLDFDYKGLCNTAKKFINLEGNNSELKIHYNIGDDCLPILISSNLNLQFYIDLKKTVSKRMSWVIVCEFIDVHN